MKTNSLLTYLLYALLFALIAVLGYKACQMKKEKADKIREEAELQKTLRDMGYATDSTGSSYSSAGDSSAYYTSPAPDANGIVDAPPTTSKTTTTKPTTASKPTTAQPAASTTQPTAKSTTTAPALTAKGNVSKVKGPGTGKYTVRAGSFSSVDRARDQLEKVIQLGHPTAEVKVSPTNKNYWTVVILRTNDRAKADRLVDQLIAQGLEARVY